MDSRKKKREPFDYLDLPRPTHDDAMANVVTMLLEYSKYQRDTDYETNKILSLIIASTAATIGIGWSVCFFAASDENFALMGLGLGLSLGTMVYLMACAPRMVDSVREGLDNLGAAKFFQKWILPKPGVDNAPESEKGP